MFGLFKAKPPLGPWEKAWTEQRLCWLADQFGMSGLLETPTLVPDFDGIPTASTEQQASLLLEFLQNWMKVDTGKVKVKVFSDVVSPDSIGTIDSDAHTIQITEEQLGDRDGLIAEIANHLARLAVVNVGVEPRSTDDAWTISLLPVFLGLGIFVANAKLKQPETGNGTLAWSSLRPARQPAGPDDWLRNGAAKLGPIRGSVRLGQRLAPGRDRAVPGWVEVPGKDE